MVVVTYAFHQHILERNWEAVENDLRLSSGQNMVKERYGNSRSLPLHLAIQNSAPDDLILGLLRIYPQAAHVKTKNGDLPMHVCCKFGASPTVVEALLLEFPEAITIKTTCKIGSIGFLNAKEIAQRNPALSRQVKSLLEKPVSHWISLASHEKVMREKSFDTTLSSMKAELLKSKQNEYMLLDRLAQLEKRLMSVEKSSHEATVDLEKMVNDRMDAEHQHIVHIRNDVTSMAAHQNDERYSSTSRNKRVAQRYTRHCSSTESESENQARGIKPRRRGSSGSLTSRSVRPHDEDDHRPSRRRGSLGGRITSAFQRIRRSSIGRKSEEDIREKASEKARQGISSGAAAVAGYVSDAINPF